MNQDAVLNPEEIARVLTREGEAAAPGKPTLYSLRHPMAIAPPDEPAARARLDKLALALQQALQHELSAEIALAVQGFRQEQVAAALEAIPGPAWVLSFVARGGGGAALALDPSCALSLVELALGGAGNTSSSGREPTPLESRVMTKLCTTLLGPFGRQTGTTFERACFTQAGVPAALADPGQTIGLGLVRFDVSGAEHAGLLLATPRLLVDASEPRRPDGGTGPLLRPIRRVAMEAQPVLKGVMLSLRDLAALRPGTLLDLELPEQTDLYLKVNGRDIFRGHVKREPTGPVFSTTWRRGRRLTERDGEES